MSKTITVEDLTRLLSRVPGANWSCRVSAATGERTWIYLDARIAEMYDTPEEEIRAEPMAVLARHLPEDRPRIEASIAQAVETLSPVNWTGRILRRSGELRWIESHVELEREADGSL